MSEVWAFGSPSPAGSTSPTPSTRGWRRCWRTRRTSTASAGRTSTPPSSSRAWPGQPARGSGYPWRPASRCSRWAYPPLTLTNPGEALSIPRPWVASIYEVGIATGHATFETNAALGGLRRRPARRLPLRRARRGPRPGRLGGGVADNRPGRSIAARWGTRCTSTPTGQAVGSAGPCSTRWCPPSASASGRSVRGSSPRTRRASRCTGMSASPRSAYAARWGGDHRAVRRAVARRAADGRWRGRGS